MRFRALATDYDGTIADDGTVDDATLDALQRCKGSGRKIILVTGRDLDELIGVFPAVGLFDLVVADNGGLLYWPATHKRQPLAGPPPAHFVQLLRERGVTPLDVGSTIVATRQPHETVVLQTIRELGLELQLIFNKGAVMILPSGVNKATGLKAALLQLGIASQHVVSVGDAENDHSLLSACGMGVAVRNAVPLLQTHSDFVTEHPASRGVIELIEQLLADDLSRIASTRKPESEAATHGREE